MSGSRIWGRAAGAAAVLVAVAGAALGAEIVHADGRRETVKGLRQDARGAWLAERDGRTTVLRPGEIAAVVGDDGKETVTIPPLSEEPETAPDKAVLDRLLDPKNAAWQTDALQAKPAPTRAAHDRLLALAESKDKAQRSRAVTLLTWLRTRESVTAAARAVVAEKDRDVRRTLASALFSVREILSRAGAEETVRAGLADADAVVRIDFALLSPPEEEAALKILRTEGIAHSDHHVREDVAVELARRGDATGEPVLISMLARKRLPGLEDADQATMESLLAAEHVRVCGLLGKLRSEKGRRALEAARKSPFASVRDAAAKALEGW